MMKKQLIRKQDVKRIGGSFKEAKKSAGEFARQSLVFARGSTQLTRQGISSIKSRAKRAKQDREVKDRIKTFFKKSIY